MTETDPMRRRRFLAAGLLGWATLPSWRSARADGPKPAEDADVEAVRAKMRAAGLEPARVVDGDQYRVVGDPPEPFMEAALGLCDGLAADYTKHFEAHGFEPKAPDGRLTVVVLSGPRAFAAYLGEGPDAAVGGIYDLATNRLVMFDNRASDAESPLAERANTVTLVHEATHQLTFNTGLLDRGGDVPLAISEGLATYGETHRPGGRGRVGEVNAGRMAVLVAAAQQPWIATERLVVEDSLFEEAATQQLAYAQAWLLIDSLMDTKNGPEKLRSYLDAIRPRRDAAHRAEDARAAFGELDRLDRDLYRRAATRIEALKSGPAARSPSRMVRPGPETWGVHRSRTAQDAVRFCSRRRPGPALRDYPVGFPSIFRGS